MEFRVGVLLALIHVSQQSSYGYGGDDFYTGVDTSDGHRNDHNEPAPLYSYALKEDEKKCAEEPTTDRRCGCDPDCAIYGDCCPDSIYFKAEEQKLGASLAKCYKYKGEYFYVMTRCPVTWNDLQTRHLCEHPDKTYPNPVLDTLITSLRTNITYRNSYCATCHNDHHQDMFLWPIAAYCGFDTNRVENMNKLERLEHMAYDVNNSWWYFDLSGLEIVQRCVFCTISISAQDDHNGFKISCPAPPPIYFPNGTKSHCLTFPELKWPVAVDGRLRYCQESISECAPDWNDTSEVELCEAYSAHVTQCIKRYRNYHCALCNYEVYKAGCIVHSNDGSVHHHEQSFSKLLETRNQCGAGSVYDSFSHECVTIPTYQKGWMMETDSCTNISIAKEEYILREENNTVFVPALKATFYQHEYFLENDVLVMCLPVQTVPRFYPALGYISMIGLSLSIICIILHLTVLCVLPKLINLPSLNLASLCVSLLLLYCSFIASGAVDLRTVSCVVVAAVIHYSLLTSFFWMLIISFDIFSMTWRTKSKYVAIKGIQVKRFMVYSAVGWLTPALIAGCAVLLDILVPASSFSPGYGEWTCWFTHSNALLLFCLVPLVLIMCLNVMFFLWTSYLIRQTRHTVNKPAAHGNFKLNLRLFIIMGLTWLTGIIATAVGVEALWHIFVLSNTTQGVFIFLAFSFNSKVRQDLQDLFQQTSSYKKNDT